MSKTLTILERTFRPAVPLALRARRTLPFKCGIYFLVDGDDIVYVGSSTDLDSRLYQHTLDRRSAKPRTAKRWDRARWLPLPERVHGYYEGALIRALRPRYNRGAPRHVGWDNEILDGLGLPTHDDEFAAAEDWVATRRRESWRRAAEARAALTRAPRLRGAA